MAEPFPNPNHLDTDTDPLWELDTNTSASTNITVEGGDVGVKVLRCVRCGLLLCERAMAVFLATDHSQRLFSTDFLTPTILEVGLPYSAPTCDCVLCDIACVHCATSTDQTPLVVRPMPAPTTTTTTTATTVTNITIPHRPASPHLPPHLTPPQQKQSQPIQTNTTFFLEDLDALDTTNDSAGDFDLDALTRMINRTRVDCVVSADVPTDAAGVLSHLLTGGTFPVHTPTPPAPIIPHHMQHTFHTTEGISASESSPPAPVPSSSFISPPFNTVWTPTTNTNTTTNANPSTHSNMLLWDTCDTLQPLMTSTFPVVQQQVHTNDTTKCRVGYHVLRACDGCNDAGHNNQFLIFNTEDVSAFDRLLPDEQTLTNQNPAAVFQQQLPPHPTPTTQTPTTHPLETTTTTTATMTNVPPGFREMKWRDLLPYSLPHHFPTSTTPFPATSTLHQTTLVNSPHNPALAPASLVPHLRSVVFPSLAAPTTPSASTHHHPTAAHLDIDACATQPIPDDLRCAICLEVMCQPTRLVACGHSFCRQCITRVVDTHRFCPLDRCPVDVLPSITTNVDPLSQFGLGVGCCGGGGSGCFAVDDIEKADRLAALHVSCGFESCGHVVRVGSWVEHVVTTHAADVVVAAAAAAAAVSAVVVDGGIKTGAAEEGACWNVPCSSSC